MFNLSLNSKIIPGEWKLARITPIYKGTGDIHLETNYHPVSVLSHIAKIFERRVHEQFVHYLELHSFITPYQSAYLKKHSTVTCPHRVVDDMYESIDDVLVCGVCFLNIEKCFDTINHDILLQKLRHYGNSGNAFDWFRDYLCGRRQCVRVDNITSELRPCPIGVPQGSILGPILFLLYVNEFLSTSGTRIATSSLMMPWFTHLVSTLQKLNQIYKMLSIPCHHGIEQIGLVLIPTNPLWC